MFSYQTADDRAYAIYCAWCKSLGVPAAEFIIWMQTTDRVPVNQGVPHG
jgi:hypothetical protein